MNSHTFVAKLYGAAVILIVVLLAWAGPVFGQLSLISVSPTNGATNVTSPATIVLEFSAPLDTSAKFEVSAGFYLGIEIFPKDSVGSPEEVTLSPDLKTVTAKNFSLTANTKFVLFLSGAKSASGELLDRPYAVTFTSGSSLPTATISGTVNFTAGNASGVALGLFKHLPFGEEGEPEAIAVVTSSSGNYTIDYVQPGTYLLLAFKDSNGDGSMEPGDDAFGGYDANGDHIADKITVPEGAQLTGLNLSLTLPVAVTARQNFPTVQTIAQTQFSDAILSALFGNALLPTGRTPVWIYIFYSTIQDSVFGLTQLGNLYFFIPDVFSDPEGPDLTLPLPDDWIDSDVASDSAEFYGGSAFRQAYPDAESNAALLNAPLGSSFARVGVTAHSDPSHKPKHSGLPSIVKSNEIRFFISAGADTPVWFFAYDSPLAEEFINIVLDARTGSPVQPPGPANATSARANLASANQAATQWASDAQLVLVGTHQSELTPQGNAAMWFFIYHSASLDSEQVVILLGGNVLFQGPIWDPPSKIALPDNWIDSQAAMNTAEANGGSQYRGANQNVSVSGGVSRGFLQPDPQRAVWKLDYVSSSSPPLTIFVDAINGAIVGVEEQTAPDEFPRSYVLQQNYPNPFSASGIFDNPSTTIAFSVPKTSLVTLKIYDVLGNEVATLISEKLPAGKHQRVWEAKGLASGIYLFRLEAGSFVQTKKLLLLR